MNTSIGSLNLAPDVHRGETAAASASSATADTQFSELLAGQTQLADPVTRTSAATDRITAGKQNSTRDFTVALTSDRSAGIDLLGGAAANVASDIKDNKKTKSDSVSEPGQGLETPIILAWLGATVPVIGPTPVLDAKTASAGFSVTKEDALTQTVPNRTQFIQTGEAYASLAGLSAVQAHGAQQLMIGLDAMASKPSEELSTAPSNAGAEKPGANTFMSGNWTLEPAGSKMTAAGLTEDVAITMMPTHAYPGAARLQALTVFPTPSTSSLPSNVVPLEKADAAEQLLDEMSTSSSTAGAEKPTANTFMSGNWTLESARSAPTQSVAELPVFARNIMPMNQDTIPTRANLGMDLPKMPANFVMASALATGPARLQPAGSKLTAAGLTEDVAITTMPAHAYPGAATLPASTVLPAPSISSLPGNVIPIAKADAAEQLLVSGASPELREIKDESQPAASSMPTWTGNFQFQPIHASTTNVSAVPTSASEVFAQPATSQLQLWLSDVFKVADFGVQEGLNDPLQVRIELSGNEVNVHFKTDTLADRKAIGVHLERLQEMLQSQGLSLGGTSIGGSSGGGQSRPDQWPTASVRSLSKPAKSGFGLSSGMHATAVAANGADVGGRQGIDVFV